MSPQIERPRCGAWMPQAKVYCARALGHCRPCMTPEAVRRMHARSVAYHTASREARHVKIDRYKLDKGCIDCGYAENPVALDFDHRDQELKTLGVSSMLTYSWRKITEELDKCDVRCANCHRIRTQALGHSGYRRRPATVSSGGPDDEITDHLPGQQLCDSSLPPPSDGVPDYILDSSRHMRAT